jgi:hypothetical protein
MAGLDRGDRGSSRCDGMGERKETALPPNWRSIQTKRWHDVSHLGGMRNTNQMVGESVIVIRMNYD